MSRVPARNSSEECGLVQIGENEFDFAWANAGNLKSSDERHDREQQKKKARFIYDFSDFGSNQSRSASPRKLKDNTVNTSATDGNTTMCGASNR